MPIQPKAVPILDSCMQNNLSQNDLGWTQARDIIQKVGRLVLMMCLHSHEAVVARR